MPARKTPEQIAEELGEFAHVWTMLAPTHKLLEIEQSAKALREAMDALYVASRLRVWEQELRPEDLPDANRGSHTSG